jgi:tripartite ATP-independent transporter DctM subunit
MLGAEIAALLLFAVIILMLMAGYPVAFTLGGVSLLFAIAAQAFGVFDPSYLEALPSRIFGTMSNDTLVAVPLFVFMGLVLERTRISEDLLETLGLLFGGLRGGLAFSVVIVGTLTMLKRGYDPKIATGVICASGTLGQIIPPSIILVLLGDVISSAYSQAQLKMGNYSPETISVGDLFVGALIPGLILVGLYVLYIAGVAIWQPERMPAIPLADRQLARSSGFALRLLKALVAPLVLILAVLGSILAGVATPTEAAAVGAVGALVMALAKRELSLSRLHEIMSGTVRMSSMVFMILIGASVFSLVFRGLGGDDVVHEMLTSLPGGVFGAMLVVMLLMFLLGFVIDFIEITYIIVPIVAPVLLAMGLDPLWLGIMIAMNLQTSFLTPPFGFALFYLRGVAPESISTATIYRGAIPWVLLQGVALIILAIWPELVTWLPRLVYGD